MQLCSIPNIKKMFWFDSFIQYCMVEGKEKSKKTTPYQGYTILLTME